MKPGIKDVLWMVFGAALLLMVTFVALRFGKNQSPAELLAFKARRVDVVEQMRLGLASASEAEKSAVMAITDEDSQKYADQARAATADVAHERDKLALLLNKGGTQGEKDLLAQFSSAFSDFQNIDKDLLTLAVKNTNLKAYNLAFGPAADAITDMNDALSRLMSKSDSSPDALAVTRLAFGAETAALRIQSLLAPHIAEESEAKMDALEARMTADDEDVRRDLDRLAAMPAFTNDTDLATATLAYARFSDIRAKIIPLSRENTNVRSLAISLDQKRKIMFLCQDALASLQQAILQEPIPGVTYGAPVSPR
ncbi:MAG TPA: MCP four helix bundle domain-containing protein [Verrucomicrobiae bacterium]|nr:MCP four helix bundle domain-containing protein [Verrucomicrobiae bacterium]